MNLRPPEERRPSTPDDPSPEDKVVAPLTAIAEAVRGTFTAGSVTVERRRLRLLDTVDRRLLRRGWRLEAEPFDDAGAERWRVIADGTLRAEGLVPSPPRLVDDLPNGPLHAALEPVAGIRALVPGPWVEVNEHRAALRDGKGKIRCRLVARTAVVAGNGDRRSAVRVEPLKGYEADAERVAERIFRRFGWAPSSPDALAALATVIHPPQSGTDYPSVTDPREPAGPALRRVLRALLDTVECRRDGVIADVDCEELHELRVAIRRTRSILSLLKSPDPDPDLDRAREFLAWLGQVTSPTRDLDVHILDWRALRRQGAADDLGPLGAFLKERRAEARAELLKALRSRRFSGAAARWRKVLDRDAIWSRPGAARQPIGDLAGRRILKLYRRALREGAAVTPDSPAEALHALRKTMKKLRYVLEIVRDAGPAKTVREVLRRMKELQQVLGDVQDLEVQAEALLRFGTEMDGAAPETLMAIGAQAETLNVRRADARTRFAAVFAPVARPKFKERIQALVRDLSGDSA